jgi:hypothetical protein
MKKVAILLVFLPCFAICQNNQPGTNQNNQTTQPTQKQTKNKKEKHQIGLGLKGGLNFANVSNASDIGASSRTGFAVGVFYSPPSKSIISSRTEILFSRQGYNFSTGTKEGSVDLNYIILPQLMGINITKYVQLQIGAQMAYLLNAKADSTTGTSMSGPYSQIMNYYNRFDYGAAAGIEIHPVGGLLIGARYNISFANTYKNFDPSQMGSGGSSTPPSFFPSVNAKNNVVQLFLGWTF